MMIENMQRSDLTTYEQAQGFQLMLDLGDTVEQVASKSGFSQSTIRRRVKLLSLDRDAFRRQNFAAPLFRTTQSWIRLRALRTKIRRWKLLALRTSAG